MSPRYSKDLEDALYDLTGMSPADRDDWNERIQYEREAAEECARLAALEPPPAPEPEPEPIKVDPSARLTVGAIRRRQAAEAAEAAERERRQRVHLVDDEEVQTLF